MSASPIDATGFDPGGMAICYINAHNDVLLMLAVVRKRIDAVETYMASKDTPDHVNIITTALKRSADLLRELPGQRQ